MAVLNRAGDAQGCFHFADAAGRGFLEPAEEPGRREQRGALGVTLGDGAIIQSVGPDSAAAKAGLQPGDAIVRVHGQPIKQRADVAVIVSQRFAGDKVRLTYSATARIRSLTWCLANRRPMPAAQRQRRHWPAPHPPSSRAIPRRCVRNWPRSSPLKDWAKAVKICQEQAALGMPDHGFSNYCLANALAQARPKGRRR